MEASERTAESRSDRWLSSRPRSLTSIERSVVLTVLYSDLFDYPLTEAELAGYVPLVRVDRTALRAAIASLSPHLLSRCGDHVTLRGREDLVALRQQRAAGACRQWPLAERFARRLAAVPFVRLVAVCGSLAVDNVAEDGDVDYFCVTAPRRLWLAQVVTMAARRLARLWGLRACPNYLLTSAALAVEPRSLYSAREIAQTVPIWGEEVYDAFLAENRWIRELLPNLDLGDRRRHLGPVRKPRLTQWIERLLGGRLGDLLDAAMHRILLAYYSLRLRRRGWRREDFGRFYRQDRQLVVAGGFAGAIERRLRERAAALLGSDALDAELSLLFPRPAGADASGSVAPDPHFARLFRERYGAGGG
ncbi:MAG: hypothetical protein R3190_05265 [Thermoanaerobaculia bacterium]|nr:hypothetical protein [Thermoanaerobaculia bacterium]